MTQFLSLKSAAAVFVVDSTGADHVTPLSSEKETMMCSWPFSAGIVASDA